MTPHVKIDDALRDQAVLYALGGMGQAEASAYEGHLDRCDACRAEADAQLAAAAQLAFLAPEAEPPAELERRIFDRIRGDADAEPKSIQPWKGWKDTGTPMDMTFVASDETGWERTAIEGIEARRLFVDPVAERVTMLVRMAPGTAYPSHRHGGVEECYVISGQLRVGSLLMRAGDYQRAEHRSEHVVQSTDTGCVLFLVSSMHDELLN